MLLIDRELIDQQQKLLRRNDLVLHYRVLRLGFGAVVLLVILVDVILTQVQTGGTRHTRARLLVCGVAKAHVTLAGAGSLGAVRQRGWRLRRRRLRLRLLLLERVMRLILCVLRVLYRRRRHRFVYGDSAALLVQSAAMEVTFSGWTAIGAVHWTAVSRERLVDVIGAFRLRVDVNCAVERIRALLHQSTGYMRLRRRLLLAEQTLICSTITREHIEMIKDIIK